MSVDWLFVHVSAAFSQRGDCVCLTVVHFTSGGLIAFHLSVSVVIGGSQRLVATLKEILMSCYLLSVASLALLQPLMEALARRPHFNRLMMGRSCSILRPSGPRVGSQFHLKYADHPQMILLPDFISQCAALCLLLLTALVSEFVFIF